MRTSARGASGHGSMRFRPYSTCQPPFPAKLSWTTGATDLFARLAHDLSCGTGHTAGLELDYLPIANILIFPG